MADSEESWTSTLINEQLRKRFESHDSAKVTNLAGQSCIASFMPPKKVITFEGLAGDNFAGMNNGSKIILNGDAKRFLGNGMHDGEIILNGSCEEGAGHCLSGGTIVIQGSVDGDAGVSMSNGDLMISGTVRGDIGTCMTGGTIIVCGDVLGDIGKMMEKGKILISGDFNEDELEIKNIRPADWKKLQIKLKDYGIDSSGLDFKEVKHQKSVERKFTNKKEKASVADTIMITTATLSRRPRTPVIDKIDLSLSIGKNKKEPLNLTIPVLWKGANAPEYAIWKLNGKAPNNLDKANVAIVDLCTTNINRRLDMKKPTDLELVIELIKQGSAKRIPILVRLNSGDLENDLDIIAKAGADGVILANSNIPIEAVTTSARGYKTDLTILAASDELDCEFATKLIALGASGLFLEKECSSKQLKDFGIELSEILGTVGVGNIDDLEPSHLRTNNQETAAMTGIPLAGYNSVLPMWRH